MQSCNSNSENIIYSISSVRHYFAIRIMNLLSLTAFSIQNSAYLNDYTNDHQRRQIEFLSCLINPRDEQYTYDLRFLSFPDPGLYSRGRITAVLLCRADEKSMQEAKYHADGLLRLLSALFDEYEFKLISAEKIRSFLDPFEISQMLTIRRKCTYASFVTLSSDENFTKDELTVSIGFAADERSKKQRLPNDKIIHIYPYIPSLMTYNNLFKLLLLQPYPVAVSCRMQPTVLRPEEEYFIKEQIAICERYAQLNLGTVSKLEHISKLQPTLQYEARMYQQYQSRMLYALRNNAARLTVEIASTDSISLAIANTVGTLITAHAGWVNSSIDTNAHSYLAGGYEIVIMDVEKGAAEPFKQLEIMTCSQSTENKSEDRILYLFDTVEAAAAFRFPPATLESPMGFDTKHWRNKPAPREMPEKGLFLGISVDKDSTQPIYIGRDDRLRHIYAVGQTGTGKTTLLKTMILDDINNNEGLCVIDPHGDLFKELLNKIPDKRLKDVVLIDPTDTEYPVGLNMLEYETESQRHFLIQEMVGIVSRLIEDEFGYGAIKDFAGPIFFQHLRMNLLLTMSNSEDPGTFMEFYNIFNEKGYWKRWLPLKIKDIQLERWVANVLPNTDYLKQDGGSVSIGGYIGSKFEGFVFDPMLRNIFGQKNSTINLKEIMNTGKILLVNLAKGELTDANSRFLGMVLLAKLQAIAMGRVRIPHNERRDFHVYVDEFQNIATQNFITLISEARKFGLSMILANQFISQIKDSRILQCIFGNMGTLICFRLGQADAEIMEREMFPVFTRSDLISLPNWNAYMSTLVNGQTVQPFNIQTVLDKIDSNESRALRIREHCRREYARDRKQVEKDLAADSDCQKVKT